MKLNFKDKPFSWSQMSSFKWDKEQWYSRYVMGEVLPSTPELDFGSMIGKKIETDPTYLPQVPRHNVMEHPFSVVFSDIKMVGYCDSFCTKTNKKLLEYKTGVKEWDQKRCDEHGQLTAYALFNYITNKVKPEDMDIQLIWLPTKRVDDVENFTKIIEFVDEQNIKIFKTKRTMKDILKFGAEIKKIYREMDAFVLYKSSH